MIRKIDSIVKTPLGNYLVTVLRPNGKENDYQFKDELFLGEFLVSPDALPSFIEKFFNVRELDEVLKDGNIK